MPTPVKIPKNDIATTVGSGLNYQELIYVRMYIDANTNLRVYGNRLDVSAAGNLQSELNTFFATSDAALVEETIAPTDRPKPDTHLDIDVKLPTMVCYHTTIGNLQFYNEAISFYAETDRGTTSPGPMPPDQRARFYPDGTRWVITDANDVASQNTALLFYANPIQNNANRVRTHPFDIKMAWVGSRDKDSTPRTTPITFDPTIPNGGTGSWP